MIFDNQQLKEILLQGNYVTEKDMADAEQFAERQRSTITDYFLRQDLLTPDLIGQAIAEHLNVPYADLSAHPPTEENVQSIPEEMARTFRIVVFDQNAKNVVIATEDPASKKSLTELKRLFPGKKITMAYAIPEELDQIFVHYRKTLKTRFAEIIEQKGRIAPELLEEIFADAVLFRASDIHIEPQEKEAIIRFRIDGLLQEAGRIEKEYYESLLNRIKVLAHVRTDEHQAAQDGGIHIARDGKSMDVRVSIVPTLDGEKIVMRLLAEYVRTLSLGDLGFSEADQTILLDIAKKPFGMILAVGPTGSGKTTSLYGLLKLLNRPEINIATIEDPVEYKIPGVNHIQVNALTNLTFAKGLRSIVRQDPNLILVGEIRDRETSEIAVNAALTGHLLLSTFHATDPATAVLRLLDMGLEPFLLASTLQLIVGQRLARRICESCRYSQVISHEEIQKSFPHVADFFPEVTTRLYRGKGCEACHGSGYKGRIAFFELLSNSSELQALILGHASAEQIRTMARKQGIHSLFEDGIAKVRDGLTTIEELMRVASAEM